MLTVAHLIESFLAYTRLMVRAGQTEEATRSWYESQFAHLASLGHLPAETLRTHHLVAIKLTNAFTRALKRLYKWGAEEDLVPKDPFSRLAIPPCGRRERVLTRDEVARLYRAGSRAFRRLLYVQLHTLARPGEIRQLTWGQIDWENRVILLVKFKGKKKRRDQLKARPIAMTRPVLRLLRNLHRKSPDQSPSGRVFFNSRWHKQTADGVAGGRGAGPWTANAVRCAMRVAREVAGLSGGGERVVCYTLRHTGATTAIRAGEDITHVAQVMGHARTSTTERYVHLDTSDVVGSIDRIWSRPPPKPKAG